jgi:hypothetical protein
LGGPPLLDNQPPALRWWYCPSPSNVALFSTSLSRTHSSAADAPLARFATNRVLRRGLGEISTEPTQRAILDYLCEVCNLAPTIELLQQEELPSTTVISNYHRDTSTTSLQDDDDDGTVLVSTLSLVDLAGSESVRHTGATGERQKEGGRINQR